MGRFERVFQVERPGGAMEVHDLSRQASDGDADRPLVLALHGLTGNGLCWAGVAQELSARLGTATPRVLAPDLRGRAGSAGLTGGWGLDHHVQDVLAVADHVGAKTFTLLGWSMGAVVAALAASRRPDRVRSAVLVDGGVLPHGVSPELILQMFVGPSLQRINTRFADFSSYLTYWLDQPDVRPLAADPIGRTVLEEHLRHDLMRDGQAWVSSCISEAVMSDGRDTATLAESDFRDAAADAARAGVAVELLWADSLDLPGVHDLYDRGRLASQALPPTMRVTRVPGTTHCSIALGSAGIGHVSDALERALAMSKA